MSHSRLHQPTNPFAVGRSLVITSVHGAVCDCERPACRERTVSCESLSFIIRFIYGITG